MHAAAASIGLLLCFQHLATGVLACHDSGYCSLSKVRVLAQSGTRMQARAPHPPRMHIARPQVQPWTGEIDSPAALDAALQARGYKNEIILSIFGGVWFETLLQLWSSMNRLSMGHLLALAVPDGSGCNQLMQAEPGGRGLERVCWNRAQCPPEVSCCAVLHGTTLS